MGVAKRGVEVAVGEEVGGMEVDMVGVGVVENNDDKEDEATIDRPARIAVPKRENARRLKRTKYRVVPRST